MAGALVDDSEFSFTAAVTGFHVIVWLPHLGQRLSAEREHGNAEDRFVIAVREHSDTRADEDAGKTNRYMIQHAVMWHVKAVSTSFSCRCQGVATRFPCSVEPFRPHRECAMCC